jgi:hypothetical protein
MRMWRVGGGLLSLLSLSACGALVPSQASDIPVGVPEFPGSAGSLSWASPEGITDVLEALPPASSAEALLTAAAERVRELRPQEDVRFGWFRPPAGESAGAWLQITGTPDDSIAGEEIRLEMEGAGGVWRVVLVESAIHCRRGVDAASHLCV